MRSTLSDLRDEMLAERYMTPWEFLSEDDVRKPEESQSYLRGTYLSLLRVLVQRWRPATILEIGTRCGTAARAMLLKARECGFEAEYHGLDWFTEGEYGVNDSLEKAGKALADFDATLYKQNTLDPWPEMVTSRLWPFVFVDGGHSLRTARNDIRKAWPLTEVGGRMLVHDTGNRSLGTRDALFEWLGEERPECSMLDCWWTMAGLTIMERNPEPGTPEFMAEYKEYSQCPAT